MSQHIVKKRRKYADRHRRLFEKILTDDYFVPDPRYDGSRYRIRRSLFLSTMGELINKYIYFQPRPDASGNLSFHPYSKETAAMRMLTYGGPADAVDEYLKIAASTTAETLQHFCAGIIKCFGAKYFRSSNDKNFNMLLTTDEKRMLTEGDPLHRPVPLRRNKEQDEYSFPPLLFLGSPRVWDLAPAQA